MVANVPARVVLFLSSYSPLFLILALLNYRDVPVSIAFYLVTVGPIIFLYLFIRSYRNTTPYEVMIKSVSSRDSDVMSYIVSYLLPFLNISFQDISSAVSFGIFITVIGIIYVSSNMVYINPVLSLGGYHMLEVEDNAGKVSPLITRGSYVSPGSKIDVVSIGDFAILEKKTKKLQTEK